MSQILTMPTVAEIIREIRERADLSQEALAFKAGVSKTTIQNYEKERTSPHGGNLHKIAKACGFSDWENAKAMIGGFGHRITSSSEHDSIPIFRSIPAGDGEEREDGYGFDQQVSDEVITRAAVGVADPGAYGLVVDGDSMSPKISNGDIIICSPGAVMQLGFLDGFVYAVRLEEGECTVKRVHHLPDGRLELRPDNDRFATRIVSPEGITHAAKVVGRYQRFE